MADNPLVKLPPVGVLSRAELIVEINSRPDDTQLPDDEVGDFVNPEEPLRVEIETLLEKIIKGKKKDTREVKRDRNIRRENVIKAYLDKNYPNNPSLHKKVLQDLGSYQGWEPEEDIETLPPEVK